MYTTVVSAWYHIKEMLGLDSVTDSVDAVTQQGTTRRNATAER